MTKYKVPFSGVGAQYTSEEKQVVLTAMEATDTFTQGRHQEQFQKDFSQFLNMPHAFATSSCATALELSALLLNLSSGDEVVCPAHTYCASAYPFARHGVTMKWADIDPETFVMSLDSIKRVCTEKTKAIIVVHLYGLPAPMPEIMAFAKSKNITVIEDCAQSIGASIDGKMTGSFGDISVFSFHTHKNISTLGEGGMLCLKSDSFAKLVPGLRHNGHCPYPARDKYWYPAMSNVDFDIDGVWPHNFCLGEIQCALGSAMLKRVEALNQKRRKRFQKFTEAMEGFPELVFQKIPETHIFISAHHLLPFRYDGKKFGVSNHDFISYLVDQYSIQPALQYYPLYRYPLFEKSGHGSADVPETDRFYDNMVSLPFHHGMPDEDFEYMINAVKETAKIMQKCKQGVTA